MSTTLSICIPTYNRSRNLRECLNSVMASIAGHEGEIEIIISDNASTDDTESVIRDFQDRYPWIQSHRNAQNIGAERNFYLLATLAQGDNIWIFGDDDKMEVNAVARVLDSIRAGYVLTICNYSSWDKQLSVQIKKCGLSGEKDQSFEDANKLMKRFGLHLGYISAVVIKRSLFLKLPAEEYELFSEYGFPFVYSVYNGVAKGACKAEFIAEPLVCNRGGNSGNYDWYKYFVVGSALIFQQLLLRGYTQRAVLSAKHQVLRDFVIPYLIDMKSLVNGSNVKNNIGKIFRHYKKNWIFWLVCLPVLLTPPSLLRLVKNIRQITRRFNSMKS